MRIKSILSLIAFFATFVFSVTLIGLPKDNFYSRLSEVKTSERDRQNIRVFLWQDINRGRDRNQNLVENNLYSESSDDLTQLADEVENYVDEAQSSDYSNLPVDFQMAWRAHMNAWREHSDFLNQLKSSHQEYEVNGQTVHQFTFRLDENRDFLKQSDKINRTWYEVLRVGRKYGAYVPVE